MSVRVDRPISSGLNLQGAGTPAAAPQVRTVGEQVSQMLFGRPLPKLLDERLFPDLAALLRQYERFKRKLAALAGDRDADYALVLSDDATVCIDAQGTIYVGAALLRGLAPRPEAIIGAIAHEIGHRPKMWRQRQYLTPRPLSADELQALARHEESRADAFAGAGLAELGLPCEPLIDFLHAVQVRPHRDYHPVDFRAELIRRAHQDGARRAATRRKLFPQLHRFTAATGHIGEY